MFDFTFDENTANVIYYALKILALCIIVPTMASLAAFIYIGRKW